MCQDRKTNPERPECSFFGIFPKKKGKLVSAFPPKGDTVFKVPRSLQSMGKSIPLARIETNQKIFNALSANISFDILFGGKVGNF